MPKVLSPLAALSANGYAARSSANSNSDDACAADGAAAMFTVVPRSNVPSNTGASDAVGAYSSGSSCLGGSAWPLTVPPLKKHERHYYSFYLHHYS